MFLSNEDLLARISLGEDSLFELKNLEYRGARILSPDSGGMADELAAMANTVTGMFILGVNDKTKEIIGIPSEYLDIAETWLRNICGDLIRPQLFCRIEKVSIKTPGGPVFLIRIDVPKSLHVHQSPGGYFQRVGSSKRQMPPEVLARLFQQRSQARMIRFDEQAVTSAPAGCLSKPLWGKFTTPLSPPGEKEFLHKMRLLTSDEGGNEHPSVSGVLMACASPREYLPNAYIAAVAYRGRCRNAKYQLDARDMEGPLDEQINGACQFVMRNMRVGAVKEPARRDIPQYSMEAVFEAVVNAAAHRDYSMPGSKIRLFMFSDRLEIYSPGAIPNSMTIDSLPLRQSTRNELLASLLARCPAPGAVLETARTHIMDKRGEGVPIIMAESRKLSGRMPEYALIDGEELLLTIYAANPHGE